MDIQINLELLTWTSSGVACAGLLSFFITKHYYRKQYQQALRLEIQSKVISLEQQLEQTQSQFDQAHDEAMFHRQQLEKQKIMVARLEISEQALQDKIEHLQQSEQRLMLQFEHLANKIFTEKSTDFQQQNNQQMSGLIAPLKQQLDGFRQQIVESNQQAQNERNLLKNQLSQLQAMGLQMSQDALNLTKALKGDNKQQGNWGEIILARVLEESGLRQGHEYHAQQNLHNEQGKQFKPDIIVHLPEGKDIVIDAKMSLNAYERFYHSDDVQEKQLALTAHVQSIKQHIKGLGQKDYQLLHGINSLDYVLMFIPIEAAFLLAIEQEPQLVNYAFERNILLVSPTNLLVALRTIHNLWRYEYQNRNSQVIAEQAAKLYDKLCGHLEDLEKVGRSMDTAQKHYQAAMNKLSSGKGNLIRQAEQLQQLGINPSKKIAPHLSQKAQDTTQEALSQPELHVESLN